MTKNDWYEAGDQIKRLVQDAVDTGDFSQLGSTISDVVNGAMDGLQDALRGNSGGKGRRKESGWNSRSDAADGFEGSDGGADYEYDQTYRGSADRARRAYEQAEAGRNRWTYGQAETGRERQGYGQAETGWNRQTYRQSGGAYRRTSGQDGQTSQPVPAGRRVPGELGSKVMKYLGFGMGAIFGTGFALAALASLSIGNFFLLWGSAGTTGILCACSLLLGLGGQKRLGLTRRFRRYREVLGTRTWCKIEELAAGIGENGKYVKRDLKKMIRRGYFPVAYLDRKETLLITDQATYQQYLQAEESYAKRQDEAAAGQSRESREAGASAHETDSEQPQRTPEHQALIEEGQKYIRHIHECNDRIPGKEVSAKLDRLELVVTRIFQEAEKNPDAVSDLRKMMSYYLPTTRKLLDAYCELEDQPVSGQNIESTRREIENALDTINTAFENLLDGLYEEQAWDISSDISVLNSMLAQEGLTKKDFEKNVKNNSD